MRTKNWRWPSGQEEVLSSLRVWIGQSSLGRSMLLKLCKFKSGQDAYKFGRLAGCASFWAFAGKGLLNSWHSFESERLDAISSKVSRRGPSRRTRDRTSTILVSVADRSETQHSVSASPGGYINAWCAGR